MSLTDNHTQTDQKQKVPSTLAVYVGLSRPLAIEFHATVGPLEFGQRSVSLQMFLSSHPGFQAYDLGSFQMVPNTPAQQLNLEPVVSVPSEVVGFLASELNCNLAVSLCEDSQRAWVEISGSVSTEWTVGAVEMELLDPPVLPLKPTHGSGQKT